MYCDLEHKQGDSRAVPDCVLQGSPGRLCMSSDVTVTKTDPACTEWIDISEHGLTLI